MQQKRVIMNLFRKPEPPFSWREKTVKIRISLGEEAFYEGILEKLFNDGLLLKTSDREVFILLSNIIAIERVIR